MFCIINDPTLRNNCAIYFYKKNTKADFKKKGKEKTRKDREKKEKIFLKNLTGREKQRLHGREISAKVTIKQGIVIIPHTFVRELFSADIAEKLCFRILSPLSMRCKISTRVT